MEIFAGGASVLFAKEPAPINEILNDTNEFVVIFYEAAKTDSEWLKSRIEATLYSRTSHKVATMMLKVPYLFTKRQIAWAFYVSLCMSFSGILGGAWAIDKYGGKRKKTFLNKKIDFDSIVKRLENVEIESIDGVKLIEKRGVTEEMFIFCDPPYVVDKCLDGETLSVNQGHYSGYGVDEFEELLIALSKTKAKFLLTSYPSKLLNSYIQKFGWYSKSYDKPITASSSSNRKRKRKTEIFVANYDLDKINN